MRRSTTFKSTLICILFASLFSCEEEGDPLTLEDIYEATNNNKREFQAKINGFDFIADAASGGKEEDVYFVVGAQNSTASITIKTLDITPGLYLGEDSMSNSIVFKNDVGRVFSSNSPDKDSDAAISIRSFSEKNALGTGVFSSTLYSLDSDEVLELTNGEFNSVIFNIPFFGKMTALVNNETYKAEECSFTTQTNGNFILSTIQSSINNDTIAISLTIEDTLEVKTYDFEESAATATYNTNTFSANIFKHQFSAESGSLRITKIDTIENRVLGAFSFDGTSINGEAVSVRSGAFEAIIK